MLNLRPYSFSILCLLLCLILLKCTPSRVSQSAIVIEVNELKVNAKKFGARLGQKLKNYDAIFLKDLDLISRIRSEVTNELILEGIIQSWARRQNITVSGSDVQKHITTLVADYPDENSFLRARSESKESEAQFQSKIKNFLLKERLLKHLRAELEEPALASLKDIYKKNKKKYALPAQVDLKQIVLKNRIDAERILQELRNKKHPFDKLARNYSIAPEKDNGGALGWIKRGTLPLFDKAFKFPLYQPQGVISSPYGFHILKTVGKRPGKQQSFEEVKKQIKNQLIAQLTKSKYSSWLEKQLQISKVKSNSELINRIEIETRHL